MADAKKRARVSQEDVVKVLDNADLNIPGLLSRADRRHLRAVSKEFYQPGRKCLDAGELDQMKKETEKKEPCKNTARVMYNSEKGIQRALMCAIMSVDKELHVDVEEGDWKKFQENESVKCFDDNYALRVTVLRDVQREVQSRELAKQTLKCKGGYRELEAAFVEVNADGVPLWGEEKLDKLKLQALDMFSKVQTVRFRSEPTVIPTRTFLGHRSLLEIPQMPYVRSVGDFAFAGCVNLEHVGGMESIESIGRGAWACCHKLRDAPVMPNLTSIGHSAFYSCEAMRSTPDLSKVTRIGNYAFSHCSSLLRVDIPEKVTQVGQGAFWACENLGEVRAPPDFYQKPGVSKLAFVSCGKIANYEPLTTNNFIVNVQWKNEDLLEKKKESWFSWVYVLADPLIKLPYQDCKCVKFKHEIGEEPMIEFMDTMDIWRQFLKYYYGSDVPERNTYVRPP